MGEASRGVREASRGGVAAGAEGVDTSGWRLRGREGVKEVDEGDEPRLQRGKEGTRMTVGTRFLLRSDDAMKFKTNVYMLI